jgi:predicted dehydrogenase
LETLRYGVIGSGMMGKEHMRNIALIPGTTVTAVADPDEGMRNSARELAGKHCQAFADHRALIDAELCDAFVVVSPNHTHAGILRDVLSTDKPIMIEKPLCSTVADCRDIVVRAKGREAPVWVAMEYRYMPPLQRLMKELDAGEAGRLRMISIREHRYPFLRKVGNWNRFFENTGGTLVEKCCHFFDLMRLLAQSEPKRVYASGAMDVNFRDESYDGRTPDIIDNAFVVVDFANGIRAMLDLCMFAEGSHWQEQISAVGDKARIDALIPGPARFSREGKERASEIRIAPRDTKIERREPVHTDHAILSAGDHHGSTYFQHRKFHAMVVDGGKPEVTLEDGLKAVMMGAAAEESARTGRAVEL